MCKRCTWQALGLRRDDTFSTTMLNNTIEQLVNEMEPCAGACSLSQLLMYVLCIRAFRFRKKYSDSIFRNESIFSIRFSTSLAYRLLFIVYYVFKCQLYSVIMSHSHNFTKTSAVTSVITTDVNVGSQQQDQSINIM